LIHAEGHTGDDEVPANERYGERDENKGEKSFAFISEINPKQQTTTIMSSPVTQQS
jgi:hypothetical protein